MKSMRLTALACLLALMLPLCIACGGGETPGGTAGTTAAETTAEAVTEAVTTDYLSTLPTADFDGASYVIAAQSTEQRPNLPGEEENGEVLNDALIQRNRKTADLYNITIENLIYAGKPDPANAVKKAVTAGDPLCDLVICYMASGGMISIAQGKFLCDLADVDVLSLSEEWWCPGFYDDVNINGSLFFTTGPLSPSYFYTPILIVYNLALADSYGLTGMQDRVLDGSFTFEYFKSLTEGISADLDGDGEMTKNDLYAVAHTTSGTSVIIGSGLSTMKRNADGSLSLDLTNPALVDVIEAYAPFMTDKTRCFGDSATETALAMFESDRAVFFISAANNIITGYNAVPSCREMESDYSFLPMPKYTEKQEGYYAYPSVHMPIGIGIPVNCPDIDRTGLITETLAYFSSDYVRTAAYDKVVKAKLTRDVASEQMLDLIFGGVRFDNNLFADFGGSLTLTNDAAAGLKENYVSAAAAILDKADKALSDYIALFD